ncbi:MAG: recombination mediator RecR [Brevinematia bacterium]
MEILPKSLENFIEILSEISGIGPKTAERVAFHIVTAKNDFITRLIESLSKIKEEIRICSECGIISDSDPCKICSSPNRDKTIICVVEKSSDVLAIEKTNEFNGIYHVLGGVIAPLEGIGPDDISIDKLLRRIKEKNIKEVFFALDPDAEGETTTSFIVTLIRKANINVTTTSIAKGVPLGGNIEYSDLLTLSKAIKGRSRIE